MQGGGDPLSGTERFATNTRGVSQTLAAVVIVAIGVVLVGVTLATFAGIADRPDEPVAASTDVELGPGGVAVEVQAVSNADAIVVRKNGDLVRRITSPSAGVRTVLDGVDPGDTIVVVGVVDGHQSVLDRITVRDDHSGPSSGASGPGSADDPSDSGSADDSPGGGTDAGDQHDGWSSPGDADSGGDGSGAGSDAGDDSDPDDGGDGSGSSFALEWSVGTTGSVTAVGGHVSPVVGTGSGSVVHLDRNGSERWRTDLADGSVTALAMDGQTAFAGTGSGTLVRLSGDGSVVWSVDYTDGAGAGDDVRVDGVEVDADGDLYVTFENYNDTAGFVVAKLTPDGSTQWRVAGGTDLLDTAVDESGRVYVAMADGDGADLAQVDSDGARSWSHQLERVPSAVAADGDGATVALAASGSTSSSVERLDADGSRVWQYDTGTATNVSAVSAAGSRTYVGLDGHQSNLRVVNATGGAVGSTNVTDSAGNPVPVTDLAADADGVTVGSDRVARFSTP